MFKSTCQIEIYHFPFDIQACSLKFGSWTYDESNIDLRNKSNSAQLDSYIENGEWLLRGVKSYSESLKYECCPTLYPFVMFVISLKRRTLYFIFNLVFPCVFISFMSVLGFALPPDSGEKIALEITTLLSIIFFLQLLRESIPESSLSVPKLGENLTN
jgi:nicotinic acetylcholine receptor